MPIVYWCCFHFHRYFNSWIEAEEVKFADESSSVLETDSYLTDPKKTSTSPGKKNQQQRQKKKKPTERKNLEDLLLENDVFGGEEAMQAKSRTDSSWCEMSADIDR